MLLFWLMTIFKTILDYVYCCKRWIFLSSETSEKVSHLTYINNVDSRTNWIEVVLTFFQIQLAIYSVTFQNNQNNIVHWTMCDIVSLTRSLLLVCESIVLNFISSVNSRCNGFLWGPQKKKTLHKKSYIKSSFWTHWYVRYKYIVCWIELVINILLQLLH